MEVGGVVVKRACFLQIVTPRTLRCVSQTVDEALMHDAPHLSQDDSFYIDHVSVFMRIDIGCRPNKKRYPVKDALD
ncbi:unnamed protein product [Sphenostylis stenocarpa]|uniref:Uncharacterized protein n=1 Tax=Sphenostylis stenocarpa TaxID=92480 RepID=A0AA86SRG4_9FABA|nr:unnamed protein product [Sphenostylis stenocarpa]